MDDLDVLRRLLDLDAGHLRRDVWPRQRNKLIMLASHDLWNWQRLDLLVEDRSGLKPEDSIRLTGFQYADWQFDGDDIIMVVRSAYRGAANFHDANRIYYGAIPNFRNRLTAASAPTGEV